MELYLNREQSRGLANFFFDMAKGLFLTSIGIATITAVNIIAVLAMIVFAVACVFQALFILGKID